MGKKQHQKDKLYLTCTEWSTLYGGRRPDADAAEEARVKFRRLPYDHCCLSLQPFRDPFCNLQGNTYDLLHIVPFIKKFGKDPVTGEPLEMKGLIKLIYHKNAEGVYHCPVLYKPFNENSHIVAIKLTGNVFSFEAVDELNLKTRNFRDLLTDEPFTKKDMIVLQDPVKIDKQNAAEFYHFKNRLRWDDEEEEEKKKDPSYRLNNMNNVTRATLEEIKKNEASTSGTKKKEEEEKQEKEKKDLMDKPDSFNAATYSTGKMAASLTSTAMSVETKMEAAKYDDSWVRYSRIKKKGYIQLQTSHGALNFELNCDQCPKTCDNFLTLCRRGYYNGTVFHRLIRHFMIQGGDPTGTGKGGESIFDPNNGFEDEFRPQLVHQGRGILSMANSGPDTNKSQFFITFRSCRHLDKKHTVFGRLVGGFESLEKIEKIKTDDKDRPTEVIEITKAVVYIDPFQEVDDYIASERAKLVQEKEDQEKETLLKGKEGKVKRFRPGVGSFVDLGSASTEKETAKPSPPSSGSGESSQKRKKPKESSFGNFSGW